MNVRFLGVHVLVAIFTLALAACGETPDILRIVKASTLPSTSKPIGIAFDHAFPGGKWDSFTSAMGETGEMVAVFQSTTTVEALEAGSVPEIGRNQCMDGVPRPCRIPVSFQFILAQDLHSISMAEVKAPEPMKSGEQLRALMAFVYR